MSVARLSRGRGGQPWSSRTGWPPSLPTPFGRTRTQARGHKRIIWCGDQDSAGLKLRAATAQLFGIARFYFVNWPEGSKDANDHLRSDGAQAVRELVLYGPLP